jgi:hypothetical protein
MREQRLLRVGVVWILDHHGLALIHQDTRSQAKRLLRAADHDDILRRAHDAPSPQ